MEKYRELKEAIEKIELIDGHAHNLVSVDSSYPFINCFTEANGEEALSFAPHTLSFKRGLRDITTLYGCETSLHRLEEYRKSSGLQCIVPQCFKAAKISAILIDDGIEFDHMQDIQWHKTHVPFVARILRIERLAEKILDQGNSDGSIWILETFMRAFVSKLKSEASGVVAFKSIAAYRSGLDINTNVTEEDANNGLVEVLKAGKPARISNKNLIDYIFTRSLEVAREYDLPIQMHTGFGDRDLDLRLANPLHLRAVLEDHRFFKCRVVLLHASYPFSKEASYLASVYPQVYLDFGLAVPKLSVHGMVSSVKQLLELAPIKKLMFSTDGYAFPETFFLGAKNTREVLFSVLQDACGDGDLTIAEAIEAANDILAQNAINFYKINISETTINSKDVIVSNSPVNEESYDPNSDVSLVRVIWVDASGQHRCRAIPAKRFNDVVKSSGVGLTMASMAMTSFMDGPAPNTNLTAVGETRLIPDLSTKWKIPWTHKEEMVLADMHLKPGRSWEYCPRGTLRRVSKILKDEFNMELKAGFENEFFLLKSTTRNGIEQWVPFDATPYCSTAGFDAASTIFKDILNALQSINIPVEQLHAESGNGQLEIATGYDLCMTAADNLVYTREVIRAIARKHGLLATFVPKYLLEDIGSGSHVHISLWENDQNVFMGSDELSRDGISRVGQEFMAGVLDHLPSILAFTAPIPNSYDRIQPNTWSGAYQCWGKENREAPLRTACPPGVPDGRVSNFEIKSFDACANPHLGLASIIAAGLDGLRRHLDLPQPIDDNPATLGTEVKRLPVSLSESVAALEKDNVLTEIMGEKLVDAIKGVRKAEIEFYLENKDAWKNLINRY